MKQEPTTQTEQAEILERANKFDRLLAEPGWLEIQNFYAQQINAAILDAANDDVSKLNENALHVLRWNAKREMHDAALDFIKQTREERDRLLKEHREDEAHGYTERYAG